LGRVEDMASGGNNYLNCHHCSASPGPSKDESKRVLVRGGFPIRDPNLETPNENGLIGTV